MPSGHPAEKTARSARFPVVCDCIAAESYWPGFAHHGILCWDEAATKHQAPRSQVPRPLELLFEAWAKPSDPRLMAAVAAL